MRLPPRPGRVLARRLRLARRTRRSSTQLAALPHRDRRAVDPLRARPLAARGRDAAAPRARLARVVRGVPRRHPEADRPGEHGGRAEDAFHVIAPSLPGYGFSEPPARRGWDPLRIARAFVELMHRLGYGAYGAQGGDWGAQIVDPDRRARPRALRGHPPEPGDRVAAREPRRRSRRRTRPISRASGSSSAKSPRYALAAGNEAADPRCRAQRLAGRSARVVGREVPRVERLRRRPGERVHARSAAHERDGVLGHAHDRLVGAAVPGVPAGASGRAKPGSTSAFPPVWRATRRRSCAFPRSWVEQQYNVTHWSVMPRGGHFAAMEQPDLFVDDVRTFFRTVREHVKPAPFEYHAPATVADAVTLLAELGDDAKVLAGGQSLVPMLALRLAVFGHLVDITRIAELSGIERRGDTLWIGAGTTDAAVETSAEVAATVPLLARATPFIGHFQIRNRGTARRLDRARRSRRRVPGRCARARRDDGRRVGERSAHDRGPRLLRRASGRTSMQPRRAARGRDVPDLDRTLRLRDRRVRAPPRRLRDRGRGRRRRARRRRPRAALLHRADRPGLHARTRRAAPRPVVTGQPIAEVDAGRGRVVSRWPTSIRSRPTSTARPRTARASARP